jgi:hypothetical protein
MTRIIFSLSIKEEEFNMKIYNNFHKTKKTDLFEKEVVFDIDNYVSNIIITYNHESKKIAIFDKNNFEKFYNYNYFQGNPISIVLEYDTEQIKQQTNSKIDFSASFTQKFFITYDNLYFKFNENEICENFNSIKIIKINKKTTKNFNEIKSLKSLRLIKKEIIQEYCYKNLGVNPIIHTLYSALQNLKIKNKKNNIYDFCSKSNFISNFSKDKIININNLSAIKIIKEDIFFNNNCVSLIFFTINLNNEKEINEISGFAFVEDFYNYFKKTQNKTKNIREI